jgi:hypothetical protein
MRWLEYSRLFVELIVGIAWPLVAAGILWGFWSYRDQIIALLPRVTEAGPFKFGSPPPAQEPTPPPSVGQALGRGEVIAGEAIVSGRGEASGHGEASARGEAIASPDAAVAIGQFKGAYRPEVLEPA